MHKVARPYTDPGPLFRHGGTPPVPHGPLLDFSVNVNPLGPPASVLRALHEALPDIARYPDPQCAALTRRLAAEHGVDLEQVVVGNGSNELIHAITRAVQPRRVAIVEPTYTEYLRAALLVGAEVDHWLPDDDTFQPEPFDPEGADLIWLCSPNNPTAQAWPITNRRHVEWIAAHPRSLFILDEAFLPLFSSASPAYLAGGIPVLDRLANLVVLRSLTKLYALPGLRLGYAITNADLAKRLRSQVVPWSVNRLAQVAGLVALDDWEFKERTDEWMGYAVTGHLHDTLPFWERLGALSPRLHPLHSLTNFVLARVEGMTSAELAGRLLKRGIAIRDASNFVGLDDHYIRVAIRTAEDNRRLFDELGRVLREG